VRGKNVAAHKRICVQFHGKQVVLGLQKLHFSKKTST